MKRVPKHEHTAFLKKAIEFLEEAEDSLRRGNYNASVANSVHSVINATDALTVFYMGKRGTDRDHRESRKLLDSLKIEQKIKLKQRISLALSSKTDVEYTSKLFRRKDAESQLKNASRFLDFVKKHIE